MNFYLTQYSVENKPIKIHKILDNQFNLLKKEKHFLFEFLCMYSYPLIATKSTRKRRKKLCSEKTKINEVPKFL